MTQTTSYQGEEERSSTQVEGQVEEMSMEGLLAETDNFRKKLYSREIIGVKVIQVNQDFVLVDIGEKKEGVIPTSDFKGEKGLPVVGTEINAIFERRGGEDRQAYLSHAKALEVLGWETCKKAFEEKARAKGTILELVKGGYIVDVQGVRGFMPLSLSELHPAFKHHLPVGAKIRCQIVEMVREKNRMIVSRKQVLEDDEKLRRDKVLGEIKVKDVLRVVVSRVGKDCLYLRYHGIEGVVRANEVAWKNSEEALKTFRRGQRLRAKLLTINKDAPSLDFSLRQLYPNPADMLRKKYQPRAVVKVKVISADENGAKVSISPDVNGFIPASELPTGVIPAAGDAMTAVVIGVNNSTFEVTLSTKRYEDIQNRKIVAQYMKSAPPLTLGQLLSNAMQEHQQNQEEKKS